VSAPAYVLPMAPGRSGLPGKGVSAMRGFGPAIVAVRRMAAAGLVLAALAGAAGCGSSGGGHAANPLAGVSARHIFTRAVADLAKAKSVRVRGVMWTSDGRLRMDLRMARGKGCTGRIAMAGKGSFRLVLIGKTVWIKANTRFLRGIAGGNTRAVSLLSGKYLKTSRAKRVRAFAKFCRPGALAKLFRKGKLTDLAKGPVTTISGRTAVKLTDTWGAAYVSAASTPEFVKLIGSQHGHRDRLSFGGYGARVTLRRPPAGQTIDGKQFGF
jgi:hypothetical protein